MKLTKPNILILITDQQRHEKDWPKSWAQENLPSMQRLLKNGMDFSNAFTASCACSPSRASLLTGTFPSQNGVYHTLAMPGDSSLSGAPTGYSQQPLMPSQPNLAHILKSAGYKVIWKGKWHLSLPVDGSTNWSSKDIEYMQSAYGFEQWNPNDAGNSVADYTTLGGGTKYNNDARYVEGIRLDGDSGSPKAQSAIEFLANYQQEDGPFCLVVSIVNPHDIWVAPGFPQDSGYSEELANKFDLPIPENVNESLDEKPSVQSIFRQMYNIQSTMEFGKEKSLKLPVNQKNYVNFYAYLQTLADQHVTNVLDQLDASNLTESTLIIRLSDHGELGMAHGMREKMFQAYDETINVPLIFSNPKMFPEAKESNAMVSSLDILPTLAQITGVYDKYAYIFKGKDLTSLLNETEDEIQKFVHFCSDDYFLQNNSTTPVYIRAIRSKIWFYAVYYNTEGSSYEYEMYDLIQDPHQNKNLAGIPSFSEKLRKLHTALNDKMVESGTAPAGIPMISKALLAEQANANVNETGASYIADNHWPIPSDAIEQSIENRINQRPDTQSMAQSLVDLGFKIV